MTTYLALLRGVNVGGNAIVKMDELKAILAPEFSNVRTYIQSGNVIFESIIPSKRTLAERLKARITINFKLDIDVATFTAEEWLGIVADAPSWWGKDPAWKHNLLILTQKMPVEDVVSAIGELKPDIERVEPGNRVVYQSMEFSSFGRTTTGKLASNPIYGSLTVRNYNTVTKLAELLRTREV